MDQARIAVTLEDLQKLDAEDQWVEVEDGEIIAREEHVTFLHVIIIQNLYSILKPFVKLHKLGTVYIDGVRYIVAGTPQDIHRAKKPDLSFLRAGRIPKNFDWSGDFVGAPDFAVEVASPGQTNAILLNAIARYLQAGTEEAWLIYPNKKIVYQYRRDAEEPNKYEAGDVIDTSALFSGLKINVDDLFVTDEE
jgi:Uma2 family endonuclease